MGLLWSPRIPRPLSDPEPFSGPQNVATRLAGGLVPSAPTPAGPALSVSIATLLPLEPASPGHPVTLRWLLIPLSHLNA